MNGLLVGRLALVTGAGSGIGEGIAKGMAKAGARVVAVDIDGAAAERTAQAIGGDARSFAGAATGSPPRCGARSAPFRCWSTMPASFAAAR